MSITFSASSVIKRSAGNTHYFDENQDDEVVLGTFSGLNLSAGSYRISTMAAHAAFYKLVVNNGVLELRVANKAGLNFESLSGNIHAITIEAGTGTGRDAMSLSLNLEDVNEAPTGIRLRLPSTTNDVVSVTIDENMNPGRLGSLRLQDPDTDQGDFGRLSASWQIDPASPYANLFEIEAVTQSGITTYHLRVKGTIDYEALPSQGPGQDRWIDLPIIGRDNYGNVGSNSITQNIRIVVKDVPETPTNTAPTDITLSNASVSEDRIEGHVIGTLSATDVQGGAMTYTIVNDPDSKFAIVNGQLVVRDDATFNFEGKTSHDVRVQVTDSGGLSYQETLTVTVTNVNEAPTDITLSNTTVSTTAGGGAAVGQLGFVDPDSGATGTFVIQNDPNNLFQIGIVAGIPQLQVRNGANLTAGTYNVTVRVTDQGNLTYDEQFTITVTSGNTNPVITGPSTSVIRTTADTSNIQPFSDVSISDTGILKVVVRMDTPSKGQFVTTSGDYDQQAGTFTIIGIAAQVNAALQALQFNARDKTAGSAAEDTTFTITVTDDGNLIATNSNITVRAAAPSLPPQNQAPNDILVLSGGTVQELAGNGSTAAVLGTQDPDDTSGFVYSIVNPDGRFAISGDKIVVANGVMLDFEQKTSHVVRVRVTDKSGTGRSYEEDITINVSDLNPETMNPLGASPLNDVIKGSKTGNFKDTFFGGAGDDKLWGGYGNDTLWGGTGKDFFVFDGKLGTSSTDRRVNFDTIKDYSVKDDSIWLDNDLFKSNKKLYASIKKGTENAPLKMASKFFTVGDKAKQADDYFVYDAKKRVLYYDADGSGSKAAIEMATFTNNKALKAFTVKELFFI